MAEYSVTVFQGDTRPTPRFVLLRNGAAIDLTGASAQLVCEGMANVAMTIVSPATGGTVDYAWQGETGTLSVGRHGARIRVTHADGTVETWPDQDSTLAVIIKAVS